VNPRLRELASEAVLNGGPADGTAWFLAGDRAPLEWRVALPAAPPRYASPAARAATSYAPPLRVAVYRLVGLDGPRALYLFDRTEEP
jgi:hypothetical protein